VRPLALLAVWVALPVALAVRIHNALHYPPEWGFDAAFSWEYIEALRKVWHLPAPDAGWSTADPPLYYALAAALMRVANAPPLVPWLNLLLGLGIAALAARLVRQLAPSDAGRAWLAAGLVLYLPAHVHMSAMVNKEMLAAFMTSAAICLVADPARTREEARPALRRALAAGVAAGLALLTKLSGVLAAPACAAAYVLDARERIAMRSRALRSAASSPRSSAAGSSRAIASSTATSSRTRCRRTSSCSTCRPASARSRTTCASRSPPSRTRRC